MANKTKQLEKDRRARVEAMRREQQAKERRKSLLFIIVAVVLGIGLVAAAALPAVLKSSNDPAKKSIESFGVSAAAASCDAPTTDKVTGNNVHVGPGTNQPNKTKVKYAEVPPSSGEHFVQPVMPAKAFYSASDRPALEQLVHNLEHGYTILWYDDSVAADSVQMDQIRAIASKFSGTTNLRDKFKAVPWTSKDGKSFPSGQHVAFTHWSVGGTQNASTGQAKQVGVWQYCSSTSGAALQSFMDKYPFSDSPEPAGM